MKTLYKIGAFFFSSQFALIGTVASVLGLCFAFIPNNNQSLYALISFNFFLIIVLFRLFYVTKKYIDQKSTTGNHHFATYVRYSTTDGKHIVYELHKYIQCKSIIMDEHIHSFYWTGTKPPIISSLQQQFKEYRHGGEDNMDVAILKFKRPLIYNEFAVIHIKMDLDDTDNKSKKRVSSKIQNARIQLLNFRIELGHLTSNHDAKLMRKKINPARELDYEIIRYVPFDKNSKSYEAAIFDIAPGYVYKIDWE